MRDSAILTILQIDSAANDPVTRYSALLSMICALMSLLYGCIYIIRFGTMRKTYKAAEWAQVRVSAILPTGSDRGPIGIPKNAHWHRVECLDSPRHARNMACVVHDPIHHLYYVLRLADRDRRGRRKGTYEPISGFDTPDCRLGCALLGHHLFRFNRLNSSALR